MCATYELRQSNNENFYENHMQRAVGEKNISFVLFFVSLADWSGEHGPVQRQLSVSSDSKLLDDDIREETRVIMRPKKPPRPKSEVFLNKHDPHPRRKRFSAFGVSFKLNICFLLNANRKTLACKNIQSCRETENIYIFITTTQHDSLNTKLCCFCAAKLQCFESENLLLLIGKTLKNPHEMTNNFSARIMCRQNENFLLLVVAEM